MRHLATGSCRLAAVADYTHQGVRSLADQGEGTTTIPLAQTITSSPLTLHTPDEVPLAHKNESSAEVLEASGQEFMLTCKKKRTFWLC